MRRFWKILVLSVALVSFACGDDTDDAQNAHTGEVHVHDVELVDRSDDSRVAYSHGEHWHGDPLEFDRHEEIELGFRFLDENGESIALDLGGEYTIEVHEHGGADILDIAEHGDHVDIEPTDEGETELHIALFHGSELVFEAPELGVHVHDEHENGHDDEVHDLELIDRSHDSVLIDTHGDHWEGAPFELDMHDELEIGFRFFDDEGAEIQIDLGGEYTIEVHEHGGADILDIAEHGDHIDIEPADEGETELHIALFHGSELVYEAPDLDVHVNHDHD